MNFLQQGNISFLNNIKSNEIQGALSRLNSLKGKLNQAEQIKEFIRERKQLLQEQLAKFGLLKDLKKYSQKVQYYQMELAQYKELYNEPDKLIAKSLSHLQKLPAFREFFEKHSELSSLFRLPGNGPAIDPASLAGLQTRASVQNLIQQRFGSSGANVQQMVQQQVGDAQSQLSQLKDKLNQFGGTSSDLTMPDNRINNQKIKSFRKRLEPGFNIQTVRSNGVFPVTTDFSFSLGFRASDNLTAGGQLAYKMGWGENFRKINITHQGIGIRFFVDMRAKGSLFITAGAETNYRSQIREFEQLKDYTAWQKSALIGLTKKYNINKKLKGNLQLLFDCLYKRQVPRESPIKFRVGYYF